MLRHRVLLAVALAATAALVAAPARAGSGTDAFGYRWHDINDPAGCPIQADVFQVANPAQFASNVVGGATGIDIGFPFPFYDRLVTKVWFQQAGLVCFQAPPTTSLANNQDIPRAGDGLAAFIAPYWSFLVNETPNVYWESFPDLGYFKVSFNYRRPQSGTITPLQFEVYLYRNGDIRIEYLTCSDGTLLTIGMEGWTENAAQSMRIRYNATQMGGLTFGTPCPFSICIERPKFMNCGSATAIACGASVAGTSPATIPTNVTQWGCGTGSWLGKERLYQIDITDLSDLNIAVTGTGTRVMAAYLLRGCDEYNCVAGGSANFQALTVTPGTYYIAVDALAARDEGAFNLSVTCTPLSDPIACAETLSGTTVGQPGRLDGYPCLTGDFSGAEQFYSVNFVPPGNLNVTLTSGTGQGIFILDASQPLQVESCLVGGVGGAVLFSPPAGQYLIVVDGPAGGDGAYDVSLGCVPELSCTAAVAIGCQQSISGSTVGQAPRADFYRCAQQLYSGPEAVYTFTQSVTQTASFVLSSPNPDLDLILLSSCNEGDCQEIGDTSISKELPPGTYFIVVDGKNGAAGDYTLSAICGFGLEPAFLSVTGAAGECFTEHKQGWLTPEIVQADIMFTIDLTGSMSGVRSQLQANMNDIINNVQVFIQDVAFGLGSYYDYPATYTTVAPCAYSNGYGGPGDRPWVLNQPMTTNRTLIESAVAGLPPVSGGNDSPESYNRMMYEVVNDPGIAWRPNSRRLLVDFGDEMPHDCNVLECLGGVGNPLGLDPGRDGAQGTADDLPTMQVVQGLIDADTAMLHLTNSAATHGAYTYTEIWDCWARLTGGQAEQLNSDGTVPDAWGITLAEFVADLIRAQGSFCRELKLVAEPGFEAWVSSASPVYADIDLPALVDFDITFCVPLGTPPGAYDFLVQLMCGDQIVTTQQVHVDVTIDCASSVVAPPRDVTICAGDTTRLDASGMSVVNCIGGVPVYEWRDGGGVLVGTGTTFDATPSTTTTYTVTVSCSVDPACSASAPVTVTVEQRPQMGAGSLVDPADCNLGLELAWDAVTFPSGSGFYNVYRSETSCADALTRAPINLPNLATPSYIDPTTGHGRAYYYVVQAEDSGRAVSCRPPGPNNGGIVSANTLCLGPVTEIDNPGFPDLLGWSLRVSHQGQQITANWTGARALLPGEHFHVNKGTTPQVLVMVNPENQLGLTWTETDTRSPLQFFDIRIANSCEEESLDDEPPGWDN